ncbi:hypothetical protein K474DRAFT_764566 [Panus rudis PR-1116 ss-1]|nr:hypothetical protein K474DRAFT_764566 [Panus rudis PR-1116 ss-1]
MSRVTGSVCCSESTHHQIFNFQCCQRSEPVAWHFIELQVSTGLPIGDNCTIVLASQADIQAYLPQVYVTIIGRSTLIMVASHSPILRRDQLMFINGLCALDITRDWTLYVDHGCFTPTDFAERFIYVYKRSLRIGHHHVQMLVSFSIRRHCSLTGCNTLSSTELKCLWPMELPQDG